MLCFPEDRSRPRLKLTAPMKRSATGEAHYVCCVFELFYFVCVCVAICEHSKQFNLQFKKWRNGSNPLQRMLKISPTELHQALFNNPFPLTFTCHAFKWCLSGETKNTSFLTASTLLNLATSSRTHLRCYLRNLILIDFVGSKFILQKRNPQEPQYLVYFPRSRFNKHLAGITSVIMLPSLFTLLFLTKHKS